ncbi:peptide/nickel transport system permease protein [Clostridium acetobutylicum]|uniref:Oligopeptide transport permease protein n=1 Tax=Clostridium acetobutylicum (strain ATCC 824 / DSM 792 / JCM 1419 / IAM 19013 / LMG 5710 / NBRC 13948 / NRRL B-527 / VKM B-1787 / 2291 / W) TaxID=272562 RepID=Q97ML9_CLOAB|nr:MULTISPECIES: ABC transporter permease [Clostridium]AAK78159.1 Oligopeptide transport permease protein [Clostridium acetobutylicum ATCC 824]ADZ19222.1 Oligopeptide transport permease protein [Clostridium acetobutylicum EA 2018]AEI33631.1 oligopeptide transport permease protein [Clostridium acetobutylicum DSM 1731]AWV81966.1 ABC transporter permease [Clostridium acetobutylicum]MBC2395966.1 ABC transporter permease [Clostridium acetobutylicum]
MLRYIVKRLLQMIPILIGVSIVIFIIFSLAPGDIVDNMGVNSHMTTAKASQLRHLYHLDKSKPLQYLYWIKDAASGNFGYSLEYRQPVSTVIKSYIWNSFILSFMSFIAAIVLAIPIGIVSATKQYSAFDSIFTVIALIGISIPAFFMGLLLIKWFCIDFKIFPVSGMTTSGSNAAGIKKFGDILYHMFLPFLVLTFESVASLMRYMRTSMLEVIRQDYIRTARAKGLKEKVVIYKHALRNSLIPVITILGMWLPGLFCGAIITEQIFSWPGIGRVTLQAVSHRDYPLLMGFTMLIAVLTLLGNLVADVAYAVVDPRIRLEH